MTTHLLAVRVVMVAAGVLLGALAYWVDRTRDGPALRPFVVLVGVLGTVAVADGIAAGDGTTLSLVWLVAYLTIPAAFAWFVVEQYGLPHLASWQRRAAFLAPIVVAIAGGAVRILSPAAQGAMAGGATTAATPSLLVVTAGFAEQMGLYYASGVMVAAVALLVRTVGRYDHLDGRLGVVLSFVCVWPWLAYVTTPGVAGTFPLEAIIGMTAGGYVLSAGAALFAVTRGGLFEAAPAAGTLGPETVLDELEDAVVVVDQQARVVRLNASAAARFGTDATTATGRPLEAVVGTDLAALIEAETVELDVAEGARQFAVSVSPVTDRLGRSPGRAVVFRDVTAQRVRAQRLSVLNRVLRHNLRNEMTTIMGRAEVIADDRDYSDDAQAILTSADDLVELGERAHEVEEMMAVSPRSEELDLAVLVEDVLDNYRYTYPDASLSADVDEALSVAVDGRILSQVLDNLVENALEHNDAPTRVVTVSVRTDADGTVRLSVADNGPGLPEQERTVIESEQESPLEHGSGLGLWAVNWGVTRLGGDLEFGDNEPQGTVVTIALPATARPTARVPATDGVETSAD